MVAILTLIFVIALSMLITKIATVALVHTGMSRERARFQARSALSGAGFTTAESELVVRHPVRRRIIGVLIIVGSAGLVTAISTLVIGFASPESTAKEFRNLSVLFAACLIFFFLSRSQRVDRFLFKWISVALDRFAKIRTRDIANLLSVTGDYEISEIEVKDKKWLVGSTLADLELPTEGVIVLGIHRDDDTYIGVPRGRYTIEKNDRLVVYGKADRLSEVAGREDPLEGKKEHVESVAEHEEELSEQDRLVDSDEAEEAEEAEEKPDAPKKDK